MAASPKYLYIVEIPEVVNFLNDHDLWDNVDDMFGSHEQREALLHVNVMVLPWGYLLILDIKSFLDFNWTIPSPTKS